MVKWGGEGGGGAGVRVRVSDLRSLGQEVRSFVWIYNFNITFSAVLLKLNHDKPVVDGGRVSLENRDWATLLYGTKVQPRKYCKTVIRQISETLR